MIQISVFLGLSLIVLWTVIMAINVLGNTKVAVYALLFGTFGYPLAISVLMALLKYQSLNKEQEIPKIIKVR